MRYIDLIGSDTGHVEYRSNKAEYAPCPQCGVPGKRQCVKTRRVRHVAMLYLPSWIVAEAGVYEAQCECGQSFQAPGSGCPPPGAVFL